MTSLSRELVFLILQFLEEEKFKETVHKLEQESGFLFNMKYFEEKALAGEWDEVEKYLSGFTKVDDNRYSMKIFFEIRKQKYLEALDRNDRAKAVEILVKDLKVFSTFNEELFKEITQLLTLENFRENEQLSKYGDTKSARSIMLVELKKLIESNPLFREKLVFPTLKASRLRTLINQSLNWQHQLCKNPRPNPDIKTLFTDHACSPQNGARAPTPVTLPVAAIAKPSTYVPLGVHGAFPPAAASANASALAGWMANANPPSSVQSAVVAASSLSVPSNQVSVLKHPRPSSTALGMIDYQNSDHEQLIKRLRTAQSVDDGTYPAPPLHFSWSPDDLPRTVACTIHQGSSVTSMDFHPSHQTLLAGKINLVAAMVKLRYGMLDCEKNWYQRHSRYVITMLVLSIVRNLNQLHDGFVIEISLQAAFARDSSISVSRVSWSPDGNLIGVAFTKHLVHLFAYQGPNDLRQHLEACFNSFLIFIQQHYLQWQPDIDAHFGNVNDLAFSHPNKQLCVVTCGNDKLVKVWDLAGRILFRFEGHEAPVYSICPHHKENIQWCTRMLYSADGSRLFSCGTSKDGDSFLVEWNESEGAIKRTYSGFRKKSNGVVQFDTTRNHFLAAGEDNQIKFWDMDSTNVITSIDADGGLPGLPCLRFNKDGNLLVVTTADNGFKILANADGIRTLRAIEARSYEASRVPTEMKVFSSAMVGNFNPVITKVECVDRSSPARPTPILNGVDPISRSAERQKSLDDVSDKTKAWELVEIVEPVQCRAVTMPDSTDPDNKVARLLYTNSGFGILALGFNGVQKLWKWSRNEQNPSGKATASIVPQHWLPNTGLVMSNDVPENYEEAVPCIALSKNDSYVMSACGGKVSLFNMMTFKVMTTFMAPPPASTFLAFHPQDNNILAIGMEDSTIHIYNVRVDEVKTKLKGHQKRITGLAFSSNLNVLVSTGADAQICFWNTESWEKRKSVTIQLPAGRMPVGDTRVQFHSDQVRMLVCHETQLAVYDASKMERIRQWVPQDVLSAPISCATYSCNSQLVYASFADGNIGVFDADNLRLRCRIAPSAYLSQASSNSQTLSPLVVTAHPQEPNQLAVGMTDGSVKVIEPLESEGKWGVAVPVDTGMQNGRTASPSIANNPAPEQLQR
ncbi:topless-related protein 2 [Quercus suber]|uniref:Topless-related protein 2 n=1 Tax=Quercus suber TaxID=58331 RepID=A0AAW0JDM9_QUESU